MSMTTSEKQWVKEYIRENWMLKDYADLRAEIIDTIGKYLCKDTIRNYARRLGLPRKGPNWHPPGWIPVQPTGKKSELPPEERTMIKPPRQTICWDCRNAVPGPEAGCSWSRRWQPVEGWDAEETWVRYGAYGSQKSYRVLECPEFEEESR